MLSRMIWIMKYVQYSYFKLEFLWMFNTKEMSHKRKHIAKGEKNVIIAVNVIIISVKCHKFELQFQTFEHV